MFQKLSKQQMQVGIRWVIARLMHQPLSFTWWKLSDIAALGLIHNMLVVYLFDLTNWHCLWLIGWSLTSWSLQMFSPPIIVLSDQVAVVTWYWPDTRWRLQPSLLASTTWLLPTDLMHDKVIARTPNDSNQGKQTRVSLGLGFISPHEAASAQPFLW